MELIIKYRFNNFIGTLPTNETYGFVVSQIIPNQKYELKALYEFTKMHEHKTKKQLMQEKKLIKKQDEKVLKKTAFGLKKSRWL